VTVCQGIGETLEFVERHARLVVDQQRAAQWASCSLKQAGITRQLTFQYYVMFCGINVHVNT
jgi:hypothetical protein